MSDPAASSTERQRDWAGRFAGQYAVQLDATLTQWLGDEQWRQLGSGEFRAAATAEELLQDCPPVIWPGLMPPDALPILGNEYGDWLCLRIGGDDQVREIIHWYHGGGDWIPWGRTLPEAIAFQMIRDHLPGRHYRHADPAERIRRCDPNDPHYLWAQRHLPAETTRIIDTLLADQAPQAVMPLLEQLIATGVASVSLHAEAILRSLDTPLRQLARNMVAPLGVDWENEAIGWRFDADLVPRKHRAALAQILKVGEAELGGQDWERAGQHAASVAESRSDLGWAPLTLGWIAEKHGHVSAALQHYSRALPASVFADQSVRFRTQGNEEDKFSARRLAVLLKQHRDSALADNAEYWQVWSEASSSERPEAIADYWLRRAAQATERGDDSAAYDALVQSGWDLGRTSIRQYGPLLTQIAAAAQQAGQKARAAVAAAHLRCFEQRFPS
ncbi:SMI1/KNR4 family protein [Roseimaritima ulvae]|uniref:Uncharacterized protein n=1 Tax=Roseimaritima ulvae TaxID=980254 RepID=A0A5B9QMQ7_9BACT|nr:SMI1/KNR4 family protein [Roseimaritima ulvae]QEG38296.1 hypothetical protein UC8_02520 [Roseimaritima ulvae]